MEIDARTLVHQLNLPALDLLGSVVNRWLTWIRLFNFDIKHVAGKKHEGRDGLSRRKPSEDDSDSDNSGELDEYMDAELTHAMVNNGDGDSDAENNELKEVMDADLMPARISELGNEEDGNDNMPNELMRVKRYLSTLRRPDGMTDRAFRAFVQYATEFLIHEGLLFRRSKPNMPLKRVIWYKNEQISIIQQMREESGHRGKKETYEKIALCYWWNGNAQWKKEWG